MSTNNYKCEFCDKSYKYSQGLSKHKKNCRKSKRVNMEQEILSLNEELRERDEMINVITEENKKLHKQNEFICMKFNALLELNKIQPSSLEL